MFLRKIVYLVGWPHDSVSLWITFIYCILFWDVVLVFAYPTDAELAPLWCNRSSPGPRTPSWVGDQACSRSLKKRDVALVLGPYFKRDHIVVFSNR